MSSWQWVPKTLESNNQSKYLIFNIQYLPFTTQGSKFSEYPLFKVKQGY